MAIFSFCQHPDLFFKKCWDDDITYLLCKVVTSFCSHVGVDDFSDCG